MRREGDPPGLAERVLPRAQRRLRARAPAPHRRGARSPSRCARSSSRASRTAARRSRARSRSRAATATPCAPRWRRSGCPPTRAPRRSPRSSGARCTRGSREAALPRPGQGQPLPVRRRAARGRPAPARLGRAAGLARRRADARARGAGATADEVVCPGVEGENLAGAALAAFREATGWDAPPQRLTIRKRVPVAAGMGGGSGDAAAALRLAAHAAGVADRGAAAARSPRALGGDVPSQVAPGRTLMTGAGEHVRPLGPAGEPRARDPALARTRSPRPPSTASSTRLGVQRSAGELAELEARGGDLPVHNDLQDAARSLCPPIDERARRASPRRAPTTCSSPGSGPTVFGLYDDPERARAAAARGRRDRGRAGRRGLRGGARGVKWGWLLAAVALATFLLARRRKLGRLELGAGVLATVGRGARRHRRDRPAEHREADRGRRDAARPLDLPARRRARVPRDRRVHRARRAGGDGRARRRPRRRPGPDRPAGADRDRLDVRGARRPDLVHDRAPARPRVAAAPRRAAEDHRGPAAPGRALLRQARRGDDPDRPLHRARARARAVHRRHLADADARVPALRRRRRGRVGDDVLRPRLRVLAVVRQAHAVRLARAVRVRHGRRDRRSPCTSSSGCGATRSCARRSAAWLDERRGQRCSCGRCAKAAAPAWRWLRPPGRRRAGRHRALRPAPAHARQPRARADDADRDRRRRRVQLRPARARGRRSTGEPRIDRDRVRHRRPASRFEPLDVDREGAHRPRLLAGDRADRAGHRRCGRCAGGAGSTRPRSSSGALLSFAAVHIAKAAYDRPRPPGALIDTVARRPIPSGPRAVLGRADRVRDRARARGRRLGGALRPCSPSPWWPSCSSRSAASTCARTTSPTCSAASRSGSRSGRSSGIAALFAGAVRHNDARS